MSKTSKVETVSETPEVLDQKIERRWHANFGKAYTGRYVYYIPGSLMPYHRLKDAKLALSKRAEKQ